MRLLDAERQRKGLSLRDVAKKLGRGYRNATRVAQYLDQRIVAGPDVLQRLAIAIGVPPLDALWSAGHHDAIFDYLHKLYRLGWSWAHHDRVSIDQDTGAQFFGPYADLGGLPRGWDLRKPPQHLAHRYHLATVYHDDGGVLDTVSLPKPIAVAILLGVALFPRRGDEPRVETKTFFSQLSLVAWNMMPAAERVGMPPGHGFGFWKPLKDAEKIWKYRFLGRMRLAVMAEYIHTWCDFICRAYTEYTQLALYRNVGVFTGDREREDVVDRRKAVFPSLDDFIVKAEQS